MTDFFAIVVVHVETGETAEFQKGRAPVQQPRDPFARQQLAALFEFVALGRGLGDHHLLKSLDFPEQLFHAPCVGGERCGLGFDLGTNDGHECGSSEWLRIRPSGNVNVNLMSYRYFPCD
jgi:hypothetical protein